MYKQVHNVSPRASISHTPAAVYLYKPPASQEEILVRVEMMFVLSWSRLEGVIYCVLAGRECELQFLRAQAAAFLSGAKCKNPAFINSKDAEFIGSKYFDTSNRKYSSTTILFG